MYSKGVTKILSSRIYAISRQEIELGNSFDSTFILFPLKIGEGQALSSGANSWPWALMTALVGPYIIYIKYSTSTCCTIM